MDTTPIRGTSANNYRPPLEQSGGGFSFAHVPMPSSSFPPLAWPPTVSRWHFCARDQQRRSRPKKQNRRKGHLQARRAVLMSGGVSIFQCHKTPYRGPHSATQGIKQPRPTPSGASRGYYYLLRARERTAQRDLPASHQAQRGPSHCPPIYST